MARHKDLSLKKPEHTSMNRAYSFTQETAGNFHDLFEKIVRENNIAPEDIWNCDEIQFQQYPKVQQKLSPLKVPDRWGAWFLVNEESM